MDIETFKTILSRGHQYRHLYHFTDQSNLRSIKQHGIVSKTYAAEHDIQISAYGGNDWSHEADEIRNLNDYVNLCFTSNHPMCYTAEQEGRIRSPVYIGINADVLSLQGVRITLDVANKTGVPLLAVEDGLDQLDREVLYTRTDWKDPAIQARLLNAEKCEILVPKRVPVSLILGKLRSG